MVEPLMPNEKPPCGEQVPRPRRERAQIGKVGLVMSLVAATPMLLTLLHLRVSSSAAGALMAAFPAPCLRSGW